MAESRESTENPQPEEVGRVLLVDDNNRYAAALEEDLANRGAVEIVRAVNAAEGVHLLKDGDRTFDTVVSDISMESQLAGLRVLRAAKKAGSRPLLAVATTGLDTPIGYAFNFLVLGLLFRSDYLIPKRPIKREGRILWIPVRKSR